MDHFVPLHVQTLVTEKKNDVGTDETPFKFFT
jgi:hypothetical protein